MTAFESLGMVLHSLATVAVYIAVLTQYTNVTDKTPHDGVHSKNKRSK